MSAFGHSQINDVISNSVGTILNLIFTNILEMVCTVSEFLCIFPTDHAVLKCSFQRHDIKKKNGLFIIIKQLSE